MQRLQFLAAPNTSCLPQQRKTLDLESTDLEATIWMVTTHRSLAQHRALWCSIINRCWMSDGTHWRLGAALTRVTLVQVI